MRFCFAYICSRAKRRFLLEGLLSCETLLFLIQSNPMAPTCIHQARFSLLLRAAHHSNADFGRVSRSPARIPKRDGITIQSPRLSPQTDFLLLRRINKYGLAVCLTRQQRILVSFLLLVPTRVLQNKSISQLPSRFPKTRFRSIFC